MNPTEGRIKAFIDSFDGDASKAAGAIKDYANQMAKMDDQLKAVREYGEVVVSAKELTKVYKLGKQKIEALRGVTMDIRQGEFVALTGPSGSGKSTLLQLIGGLDKPSGGKILVDQADIGKLRDSKLSEFRNRTVGFVFQFFYLQPFLSLETNIAVPAMFAGTKRDERGPRVADLLRQVGLADRAKHLPKELSGGQMQRAAIARALLNRPKILLADEPTGNLDSVNGQAVIDAIEAIRKEHGTTVVMVTHDPKIAARADREIKLADGRIV